MLLKEGPGLVKAPGLSFCPHHTYQEYTEPVGAALCRDRAAQRPQDFGADAHIAGAAAQPSRDTRPLLQG
ncbi:protein of unknown function [Pseudomonas sp. JV551A1]|uniref:Uncharacterized protein n=1 Tax=Pseudomonas inefficax TaxID=2078786 RepID=A0AAQ1PBA6_9PSED|nr:protein of unknown function [Pseudomonas sp. JV551A1]SPO62495.1 protein of unknown function [Pseudomonas inefficax]